jgi:biotin carboxyl carrier protein
MRYVALLNGEEHQVEIVEVSPNRFQLTIDGRTLEVDARAVQDTTLSLLHDNSAYNIESEVNPAGGETVLVRGHQVTVEVLDLRSMQLRRAQEVATGPAGPAEIAAPMPGKVVAVLVKDGEQVEEGQGLVVVEAMKMENELRSPRAGVVKNLSVEEGAAVDGGVALCVVE